MAENDNKNEMKSLSEWVKDPRIPVKKFHLWKAIDEKKLKAFRPIGGKKWLIKWEDLRAYMEGSSNERI